MTEQNEEGVPFNPDATGELEPGQVEAGNQDQPETPNTDPETAEAHDDEDVPAALERVTDDGPGTLVNLPKEDFDGFAEDDVEEDE